MYRKKGFAAVSNRTKLLRWAVLAAALAILNLTLTFTNVWPTLFVRFTGDLSLEAAILVLALAAARWRWRAPGRGVLRALGIFWVALVAGRYVNVTARSLYGRREYNLASRFLDELPPSVERERLRPASWAGYAQSSRQVQPRQDREVPSLQTGDSVRHGTLGEGVVLRIEPGGVVTVRFESDGSERRLMLDYAPLEKLGD